jgi:acetyl esterase/lipase
MTLMGRGAESYVLFEPAEPKPIYESPVVVFLHGWMSVNPAIYGAWIEHLCRRGAVVIFPRYQSDFGTPSAQFLPNARRAIRDAFDVLESGVDMARPDRQRIAFLGHSAGGNLAALLAASCAKDGLPHPRAVIAVMPGEVAHLAKPSLAEIAPRTLLLVAAGDHDIVVGDYRARQIFEDASAIPPERKMFLLYRSDRRGPTPLLADHFAPTAAQPLFDTGEGPLRATQLASARLDLLDRYGFWRAADLTMMAAFDGKTLHEASEGGALFLDLGRWSSGQAVRAPLGGSKLEKIPSLPLPHGARLFPAPPDR